MPAKQTSVTLSEAVVGVVDERQNPGEGVSACINRLVLELDRTDWILTKIGQAQLIEELRSRVKTLEGSR